MTAAIQPHPDRPDESPARDSSAALRGIAPLIVAIVTFAAFLPVLGAGFLNWDDDHNVTHNVALRGLGPEQLRWMFTTAHAGHYQPLTWLSLAADYRIWGLEHPGGFHLTNLVLHVLTALAVYALALRLIRLTCGPTGAAHPGGARAAAALAALLFAVHPLRAESVAWITERRDVLSGLFFLLSILAYVRAAGLSRDGHPHTRWYAGSILLCTLSMLAKAHAVALVGVLVLLDLYPLRRFVHHPLRALLDKVPFALLSVVFGWRAILAQHEAGALYPLHEYGLPVRAAQALYGHAFYLGKLVFPLGLGPVYELPDHAALLGRLLGIGVAVFGAVGLTAIVLRRRFPFGLVAWGWYIVLLAPVSGLLQSGVQVAADRYTYLACLGWTLAVGVACGRWLSADRAALRRRTSVAVAAGLLVGVCAALTWRQCGFWRDSVALWQRGTAVAPGSSIAHANLGDALMHTAAPDARAAVAAYARALDLNPRDAKAHNGAATAALMLGAPDVAFAHLESALALDRAYPLAHYNLGVVLAGYGRLDEAAEQYRQAFKYDPGFAPAARNWADLLIERRRYAEALSALQSAVQNLPDDPYFRGTLAWVLATCSDDRLRDGSVALEQADLACRLTGHTDPWSLDARAAALAELGRFDEAQTAARAARQAAQAQNLPDLARQIEQRLDLYAAHQPSRMPQ